MSALDSARVMVRQLLGRGDDRPIPERVRSLEPGDRVIAIVACDPVSGEVRETRADEAVIETEAGTLVFVVESGEGLAIERDPERLRGRVESLEVL